MNVTIYTDGGCSGNPGVGAWAFLILTDNGEIANSGGEMLTTNNRMELQAAVEALSLNENWNVIHFFTDSQYLKNGIQEWIKNWKLNGWKTANKKDVKNRDLWMMLDKLTAGKNILWNWVKGHSTNEFNIRVDKMCVEKIKTLKKEMDDNGISNNLPVGGDEPSLSLF
jgi:ribonuclease HI